MNYDFQLHDFVLRSVNQIKLLSFSEFLVLSILKIAKVQPKVFLYGSDFCACCLALKQHVFITPGACSKSVCSQIQGGGGKRENEKVVS